MINTGAHVADVGLGCDMIKVRDAPSGPRAGATCNSRVHSILLVENDTRTADLVRLSLRDAGYTVEVATTGPGALRRTTERTFDVVLLNLALPGLSGIEVCRRLRSRRCWIPILMLSDRDSVADRVAGLDIGADDYLVKPLFPEELTARIRALIRRGAVERPTELRVADLCLDPAARRAWRGEIELELSTKEFALLQLFLHNPDVVLSRAQILEHVWNSDYDGSSNLIDQYVLYLRRKIDRPFRVHQLETVRGAGYRLRTQPVSDPR